MIGGLADRLIRLREEVLALKTSHYKTSEVIAVSQMSLILEFDLRLASVGSGVVESTTAALITLSSSDSVEILASLTFDDIDDIGGRIIDVRRLVSRPGQTIYWVFIDIGNAADLETLEGGGSVHLSLPMTATVTSDCTSAIRYVAVER